MRERGPSWEHSDSVGRLIYVPRICAVALLGAAFAFIASQAFYYALGHKICTGTDGKIDSSWIATLLETVTIGLIYAAWQYVTEDDWVRVSLPSDRACFLPTWVKTDHCHRAQESYTIPGDQTGAMAY